MEILNTSVYLLVIFGCVILRSSDAERNITKIFNCEARVFSEKLNSTIKCVYSFSYFGDECETKCIPYANNVSMGIYLTSNIREVSSHKLTCKSGAPLSNEIFFRHGNPDINFMNLRHERPQFGSSTQEYIMTVLFPDVQPRETEGFALSYQIFNKEDPASVINVNILTRLTSRGEHPFSILDIYRFNENFHIFVTGGAKIKIIPCLEMETSDTFNLFRENVSQAEELKIDNDWGPSIAKEFFKINSTLLKVSEGNYTCYCNGTRQDDCWRFDLRKNKTNVPQNQDIHVYPAEHIFDTITGSSKVSFDLECMNHLKNITIEGEHTSALYRLNLSYPVDSKSTQISESPININITYYKDGISSSYYFASAKVPYLNTSERTALKIVKYYDYAVHNASLRCTDGNITLHNWNIYWVNGNLTTDVDAELDLLFSLRHFPPLSYFYYDQKFLCSSDDDDLELRHMECETPTECRVFLKCLEMEEVEGKRHPMVDCDKEIPIIKGVSCISHKIYDKKKYCARAGPSKNGIVQCLSRSFNVLQPYFQGFDNQLYVTSEPPLEAIIKLNILSTESDRYTNGKVTLLCEAHQFFYEHGIQWDFANLNGTSISPDFLHHVTENKSDFRYPKSTIEVSFAEITEVLIVCLAPPIGKREWQNTTTILKLKKSLPPEFHSKDTDVYFDVNKKDQSIICHAIGLPQPQIRWIKSNEVIDDASRISDSVFKTSLLFPSYNESLSGEYMCEASNIAGNKTLRFQVFTASENGSLSLTNILLISGFCVLVFLFVVFFAIYLRIQKMKKYREMKDVVELLNGNAESADNPIELPFDTKLELEKHSFYLDKTMLLGKGEFGEVYKGRIEGFDGFIAFKTLSRNCSTSHAKALVSEIKMLMYVGEHPHLVELIGVYRKEIQQGILYMALQFCDLGSLESYLRTYKYLFMKCPIISSYINTDIVERAGKEGGESHSIHSMKTLIKWCYQIANAMEYLGTKNVIHSDLASRNVLLTAEANAKVTDFGLSRRTYNYTEYVKTAKDALPWRWLALECLLTNTFSSKSDVWAYGITLWEIFSFGEMPYPGMTPTADFVDQLKKGLRNIKPDYASQELYHVMRECWHPDANERPSFSTLRIIFESAFTGNAVNIDIKISEDCNLEEIAKELLSAVYCDLEEL